MAPPPWSHSKPLPPRRSTLGGRALRLRALGVAQSRPAAISMGDFSPKKSGSTDRLDTNYDLVI